ncbi:MAG: ModE family transcriptional regulator [Bacteroidota bacterium]
MADISYTLNGRIWLEVNGEKMLGHGRVELLERIQASGSIRQAALQMKMSYKQAWDLINHINSYFEKPVVISQRGGKGGGKATITEEGRKLIEKFHQLQSAFHAFLLENKGE